MCVRVRLSVCAFVSDSCSIARSSACTRARVHVQVPYYIQITARPPTPFVVTPSATPRGTPFSLTFPPGPVAHAEPADGGAVAEVLTLDDSYVQPPLLAQQSFDQRLIDAELSALADGDIAQRGDAREGERLGVLALRSTDCQDFIHFALSECLVNLMSEAAAGEFLLNSMPRQIVSNVEVTMSPGVARNDPARSAQF